MADDSEKTGEQDDERINVDQDHELSYWSDKLGVSRDKLREDRRPRGSDAPSRRACASWLMRKRQSEGRRSKPTQSVIRAAADELRLTTPKSAKRRRRRKGR